MITKNQSTTLQFHFEGYVDPEETRKAADALRRAQAARRKKREDFEEIMELHQETLARTLRFLRNDSIPQSVMDTLRERGR